MARALINESTSEWVKETDLIGKDGDEEARYEIRPISVDRYTEFQKRCTSRVPNRSSRAMEDVVDHQKLRDLVLDFVLIGWEGILDGTTPAPCSDLAKKKMLPGVVISAIADHATQGGAGRTAEERAASFRPTP